MHVYTTGTFEEQFNQIKRDLLLTKPVDVGTWQSKKIDMPMLELLNVVTRYKMPESRVTLGFDTGARLPWADDHFRERISELPLNPSPSEAWWPFRKRSSDGDTNKDHKSEGEAFSHTYPERMWPKYAGGSNYYTSIGEVIQGIRFEYGDLGDVVNQLKKDPNTRQAFLPIWYPEDTGAVHGKRVPCTIGYHFQIRDNTIYTTYYMRSTDLLRHYQDDIYLATRLSHYIRDEIGTQYGMGDLVFHTANMHIFEADRQTLKYWESVDKTWY